MIRWILRSLLFLSILVLFAQAKPSWAAPLAEETSVQSVDEAANGTTQPLAADQILVLDLEVNLSTGYLWQVTTLDNTALKQVGESTFTSLPARQDGAWVGAPGRQLIRFAALRSGLSNVILSYRRPWETDVQPARTFSLQVNAAAPLTGAALAYTAPQENDASQVTPLDASAQSNLSAAGLNATSALSATLNWCNTTNPLSRNVCTDVRNQGGCGSCWAFGTQGVVEAAIKRVDGNDRDTSEQYLVSCNRSGYSCNGGWWAFAPSINEVPSGELFPGVRWETDFPYQAANASCNPSYAAHEVMDGFGSVTNSVDAIKQAITTYGPIAAAICVGPAFSSYKSGIFQTEEKDKCNGSVNHAIVLTGWDDTEGVWYLRNSWGPTWGESGNMRIKWGTSNVGYGATYLVYTGPSTSYTIAGYVRTPAGLGVNGATVSFGAARPSVTTNSVGYYIQTGFNNGSYTVKASATNYTITPTQVVATVNGASVSNINFAGVQPAQFHRISGYIRQPNGAGIPGAVVSFAGTNKRPDVKSDTNGFFSQDSVLDGTYTVTVVAAGYTVTPTFRLVTVAGADVTVESFSGSRPTYTVSGSIKTAGGVGIPGVTVDFAGEFPAVTTDSNGFWSRDGVLSGHPTVIPSKPGLVFSPVLQKLTLNTSNLVNINFTGSPATYIVSGTVKTSDGVPINGVTVSFGNSQPAATASLNGYMRSGFLAGTYIVSPTLSGYTFSPVSTTVTISTSDRIVNFVGTPKPTLRDISGLIRDASGKPIPNVSVSFGAARPPVLSNSSGVFTQTGFPDGAYSIQPSLAGYTFTPAALNVVLNGADLATNHFTATLLTYSISGRVTLNGNPVPATVAFGNGMSATADANGNYSKSGLPLGQYQVSPSYTGAQFADARTVVIGGANVASVNFDGTLQSYCVSGYARGFNDGGIDNATVTFSNNVVATTDEQGFYKNCDVPYGNQSIAISANAYTFEPSSQTMQIIRDQSNVNFMGYTNYFTITGYVLDDQSQPLPNVTIRFVGFNFEMGSYEDGFFGASYFDADMTVIPERPGYTFSPSSIKIDADGTDRELHFTATPVEATSASSSSFALSGHVRDESGQGLVGAMVYYVDGPNNYYLATSGRDGFYIVQGIASGTALTVGVHHPAYDFSINYQIDSLVSDVSDLDFTGTQTSNYLAGQVLLQGRYDAPSDWWFGYPLTVELFTPGAATPSASYEATLDSWGYFIVPGVDPGTYDIRIKNAHSLSQKRSAVQVVNNELVRFDLLREGDTDNNDNVWYEDFAMIRNDYGYCEDDPEYNPASDLDGSGCVWVYDISMLATNFGMGGQTDGNIVLAPRSNSAPDSAKLRLRASFLRNPTRQAEGTADTLGQFTLTPSSVPNLTVGDIFTVAVGIVAPDRGLDTVSAFLQFDPAILEVVDENGAPIREAVLEPTLPVVIVNQIYNDRGYIDLVVNRPLGSVPVTGNFDLAVLRFRLKQPTAGTLLTFDNEDPQVALSDIDLEGYGYLDRNVVSLPTVTISSTNRAPDVVNDHYATTVNTKLVVDSPGTVANDIDRNGDAFVLTSYIPPSHGELVLYDDGSFEYTPDKDFVGTDSFTYQASDGITESDFATVTIEVIESQSKIWLPIIKK